MHKRVAVVAAAASGPPPDRRSSCSATRPTASRPPASIRVRLPRERPTMDELCTIRLHRPNQCCNGPRVSTEDRYWPATLPRSYFALNRNRHHIDLARSVVAPSGLRKSFRLMLRGVFLRVRFAVINDCSLIRAQTCSCETQSTRLDSRSSQLCPHYYIRYKAAQRERESQSRIT